MKSYRFVEVPTTFSLRKLHRGHQTNLSTLEVGYLGRSNHVVIFHHDGERRQTGERYENHPFAVAEIIRMAGGSVLDQCKAKLHDILERILETGDQALYGKTVAEIAIAFPPEVLQACLALTKTNPEKYHEQLFQANINDPWIMIIKLADRLHNLRTIRGFPLTKQIMYLGETLGPFLELCRRALESVCHDYPQLLPIYEGMIRQLEGDARSRLVRTKHKIDTVAD